ncbi:putative E3 ubiquitin-protein ligase RHA4A [Artemisia annua]|uniref:Putative E3 ubiquitin-protein ligase RHA4A n=1 Tax=Artemisia annua TaxID=35608 RepID=A0A2U1MVH4_ARTAN|nr:putative E3 ubiquitin-protein ligase RHA4A [Artemisia annua]
MDIERRRRSQISRESTTTRVVRELRLHVNLDEVDGALHNAVLPVNVKELIYERSKCKNENDHDCVICLEEFQEKETIGVLEPCKHLFHTYCITRWLFKKPSCPTCRHPL